MPVLMRPEAVFDYALMGDREIPEAERPTFTFRVLTGRQFLELAALSDRIDEARQGDLGMSGREIAEQAFDLVRTGLVGWRNLKKRNPEKPDELVDAAYRPEDLPDVVTFDEAFELRNAMLAGPMTADDAKKLGPQSPSGSAASAEAAAPESDGV